MTDEKRNAYYKFYLCLISRNDELNTAKYREVFILLQGRKFRDLKKAINESNFESNLGFSAIDMKKCCTDDNRSTFIHNNPEIKDNSEIIVAN